jgi:hypothetical protein
VFRFFADPKNRPLWQRGLKSVSVQTPGEPGLGTRWLEAPLGLTTIELEVTAFEPPSRWAERGHSRFGSLELTLNFGAEGNTTRVSLLAWLRVARLLRPGAALAKPLIAREIKNDLARAARILETNETNKGGAQ